MVGFLERLNIYVLFRTVPNFEDLPTHIIFRVYCMDLFGIGFAFRGGITGWICKGSGWNMLGFLQSIAGRP